MTIRERLNLLYEKPPLQVTYPAGKKLVFMSDSHLGFDKFMGNYRVHLEALKHYFEAGYMVIFLGDHYDLWRKDNLTEIKNELLYLCDFEDLYQSLLRIGGNHDRILGFPEAVLITVGEDQFFCAHGHQGDWINDEGWELGRALVRYPLNAMEELGIDTSKFPGSDQHHADQRIDLIDWANEREVVSIFGHIHLMEHVGFYWNCGSGIGDGRECIEYDGELKLKRWTNSISNLGVTATR